jgi:tripartite-type tricarboxylate transporter receptor subunit TctC
MMNAITLWSNARSIHMLLQKALFLIFLLMTVSLSVFANDFPSRTITLIAPTAPGGAMDGVARMLMERLSNRLGQAVVIDYKPGAGGTLGSSLAAKAKPDGYTIVIVADSYLTVAPRLLKSISLQAQRDLTPVIELGSSPMVLVTNPSFKFSSLADFVKRAKTAPPLSYASGGTGSPHHLFMGLLEQQLDLKLNHVPYKGGPQAFSDVLAGHVPAMFIAMSTAEPHLRNGKLSALGVTSAKRLPDFPTIPAIGETVTGYDSEYWFAIFAPKATPVEVITRLNREIALILDEPDAIRSLKNLGLTPPLQRSPDSLARKLEREDARMGRLIDRLGLKED